MRFKVGIFMFLKIVFTFILLAKAIPSLSATTWPQLDKNNKQECLQILNMAESVFHSSYTHVYKIPKSMLNSNIELLIENKEYDFRESWKTLKVNDKIFETITAPCRRAGKCYPYELHEIHWQRDGIEGFRFVLCEGTLSGATSYDLYSIEDSLSQKDFIEQRKARSLKPIFSGSWQPPIMLQHIPSQKIWAIDVGNSYHTLSDWNVYIAGSNASKRHCTVHFRPSIKKSWDWLPKPARQLALLLDGTLGNGDGDGSLRQTDRLRSVINQTWANVARRPWVIGNARNSRAEVDLGLINWSQKNKKFLAHYQKIIQQYPKAEQALATYYENQFQLRKEKAERLAKYVLDWAFRSNFVFPRSTSMNNQDTQIVNPWNDK